MKPPRPLHASLLLRSLCLTALGLVLGACGSTPTYEGAFSAQHEIKGNSEAIAAPMDVTWRSVLEVMAQRGWLIEQADMQNHLILAHREMRDEENTDLSYALSATVTLVPTTPQITQVIAAANQTTELHKQSYTWWHLLWLIPIFPTGKEYTTVVVERDTVHDAQLYADFFASVKARCVEIASTASPGTSVTGPTSDSSPASPAVR